jgi:general secretion pathway protein G
MIRRSSYAAAIRRGFTLLEMLAVVAIIVILAGTAIPVYLHYVDSAKVDRARVDCRTLGEAVDAYKLKYGSYPATLSALTQVQADGSPATLELSALLDPWQHEYQYNPQGQHNAYMGRPDIWSLGPNPSDPNGIIGNWSAGT